MPIEPIPTNDLVPTICVGGAPSSGTTLLADLLDSVPGLICGPELYVMCIEEAYRFDERFKPAAMAQRHFATRARYSADVAFFNRKYLGATGLTEPALHELIAASDSLPGFITRFARHFAGYRGVALSAFAEKTPINVNYVGEFCRTFTNGVFVHVVRDGRDVARSLTRRGYSLYEAAMIWMQQVLAGRRAAQSHGRVVEIKYEELVNDPFVTTVQMAAKVGLAAAPAAIEVCFNSNQYRAGLPRVASWSVPVFDGKTHPNNPLQVLSWKNLRWLESLQLVQFQQGQADPHVVADFASLLGEYGYGIDAQDQVSRIAPTHHENCYHEYLKKSSNLERHSGFALMMKPEKMTGWSRRQYESLKALVRGTTTESEDVSVS
ncbi:MAG: sulfotransferase [Phycisphaeraceae bacterium]